jgi:uncharacterized protein YciI
MLPGDLVLFAVIRQEGPNWDRERGLREQDKWLEHAAFMDALQEAGTVVLGGPLGDGNPVHRVLIVFDADTMETVQSHLEEDLWTPMRLLTTVSIEPWNLLLGSLPGH